MIHELHRKALWPFFVLLQPNTLNPTTQQMDIPRLMLFTLIPLILITAIGCIRHVTLPQEGYVSRQGKLVSLLGFSICIPVLIYLFSTLGRKNESFEIQSLRREMADKFK